MCIQRPFLKSSTALNKHSKGFDKGIETRLLECLIIAFKKCLKVFWKAYKRPLKRPLKGIWKAFQEASKRVFEGLLEAFGRPLTRRWEALKIPLNAVETASWGSLNRYPERLLKVFKISFVKGLERSFQKPSNILKMQLSNLTKAYNVSVKVFEEPCKGPYNILERLLKGL